MATRLVIDGYGQIELNNCAFRRDGRIEAQCAPDTTAFGNTMLENGMLLSVDNVNRQVTLPTDGLPIALNYSAEHIYDERTPGLKNFYLKGNGDEDFYPRLGYLSIGDKYTTNCISYDSSTYATESAFVSALAGYKTTPLYAVPTSDGTHFVTASAPSSAAVLLRVIEKTTMPDGQLGVKFQVYKC